MGSTSIELKFNKDSIVNHVLVQFTIKFGPNPDDTLSMGVGLEAGWAWKLVRRHVMQYSGSQSLEILGIDNYIRCMAECESVQKRNQLIELGGSAVYRNEAGTIIGLDSEGNAKGSILLYTPHSSVSGAKQVGFDCSQCNSSPLIRLDLASPSEVYTNLSASQDPTPLTNITYTSEMTSVEGMFYVGETAMIDTANSRRDMVGPSGPSQSLMFFAYPGHFDAIVKKNANNTTNPAPQVIGDVDLGDITINQFINGSCQYLLIAVQRLDYLDSYGPNIAPDNRPNNMAKGAFNNFLRVSKMKITYGGGNTIYETDEIGVAELIDLVVNPVDSSFDVRTFRRLAQTGADATAAYPAEQVVGKSYFYRIQLSQFSELYKMFSLLQTGANLGSDNLKLSLTVKDSLQVAGTGKEIRYRVNVQQVYQTSMTVARGNVKWDYVNPSPQALPAQLQVST